MVPGRSSSSHRVRRRQARRRSRRSIVETNPVPAQGRIYASGVWDQCATQHLAVPLGVRDPALFADASSINCFDLRSRSSPFLETARLHRPPPPWTICSCSTCSEFRFLTTRRPGFFGALDRTLFFRRRPASSLATAPGRWGRRGLFPGGWADSRLPDCFNKLHRLHIPLRIRYQWPRCRFSRSCPTMSATDGT